MPIARHRGCVAGWTLGAVLAASPGAPQPLAAGHEPRASLSAARAAAPPVIDGRLTDEQWAMAVPLSGFTQQDPDEGQPATANTEVRVLYDDDSLYIAVRMFDDDPARVSTRLSKRDEEPDADRISIYLDPMHDHQTGFVFSVSASGVQRDQVLYNDSWTDGTWDAVWDSGASVDAQGWCAEVRIPLSQLRFTAAPRQTWGMNVERFIRRKNETDWLELVRKSESGVASRMAHLSGVDGIAPKRHLELRPYTAARSELIAPEDGGDPFNDGSRMFASGGLDLKYGLTSALTLNATFNPDFGQVEVDPAVVNLSAFETFFEEKRPFFLEGSQVFGSFGQGGANSFWGFNASDPQIFYSRRIGRAPHLSADADYEDAPAAATILAAAKLTGKTARGWSVGLLEAMTDRETAGTMTGGVRGREEVEPLTNFTVARIQRDIGRRGGAGMLFTSVTRRLTSAALIETLTRQAYVAGGDAYWYLDDRQDWVATGKFSISHLRGSAAAIARAQKASARYFQRPDAPQVSLDERRTSLSGFAGRINLNKNAGLRTINVALWGVSPGFESNDLGFHGTGDRAGAHIVWFNRNVTPGRIVRSRSWWIAKAYAWNFNRELQYDAVTGRVSFTFLNYWQAGGGGSVSRQTMDDRLTRGGPSTISPERFAANGDLGSDQRRPVSLNLFANGSRARAGSWTANWGTTITLKPSSKLYISTGPQYNGAYSVAQYIDEIDDATAVDTYGHRYVFGEIDQTQLTLTTRVNVTFSGKQALQIFAQPLIASGRYTHFKEVAQPRTYDFVEFAAPGRSLVYDAAAGRYTADPDDAGEAPGFVFDNPDFSLKSLRLSAVYRWELKPGSTLYLVWTREQEDKSNPGTFALGRDAKVLFKAPGDDVFLVKVAYWIGR
ncbi:MAG: carbohydrate binding family 9 domain-containing protein [Acidobacteria bacterium]|nr:carbohydrate binding family 9 domain-containing protein [Acidobacteriota bacterium]